jgi:hypothetical protein
MDFFSKLPSEGGGYLFLSHSHADIVKVRAIRNRLEEDGFDPLCFYLKCLDDDSEIEGLIKREIDAREWFLFLNSENSRRSKWVRMEREYIASIPQKKVLTIDLDDPTSVERTLCKIRRNLRVFLAYSRRDGGLAECFLERLEAHDYMVFDSARLADGIDMSLTAESAISAAAEDGCVILLLTETSVRSASVKQEVILALRRGGNVIPIVVGDLPHDRDWEVLLTHIRPYRLPLAPTKKDIDGVVGEIGRAILSK